MGDEEKPPDDSRRVLGLIHVEPPIRDCLDLIYVEGIGNLSACDHVFGTRVEVGIYNGFSDVGWRDSYVVGKNGSGENVWRFDQRKRLSKKL